MSAVHSSASQAVSPSQANGRDGDGSHRSLRRRFRKLEPVFELAGRIAMIGFGLGALYCPQDGSKALAFKARP